MCKTREHQDFPGKKYYSKLFYSLFREIYVVAARQRLHPIKKIYSVNGEKKLCWCADENKSTEREFFFLLFKNEKGRTGTNFYKRLIRFDKASSFTSPIRIHIRVSQ